MTNDIEQKIAAVLTDKSFYETSENATTPEALVDAVKIRVPEASREEIDAYLVAVSRSLQSADGELDENALDNVAGGIAITLTVTGVCAFIKGVAIVGGAAGTLYWYIKHRKCS